MRVLNILVNGFFYSGKTEFIRHFDELRTDNPDTFEIENVVARDYGQITVDDDAIIYLLAMPDMMSHKLLPEGFRVESMIIMVDSNELIPLLLMQNDLWLASEYKLTTVVVGNK